jgi:hypothetical protein
MNNKLIILVFVFALLSCSNRQQQTTQQALQKEQTVFYPEENILSEEDVKDMLKGFYTTYITMCESGAGSSYEEKIAALSKQYCTDSLWGAIQQKFATYELDYDPFLSAQDCDIESLKTLSVKKDNQTENVYIVSYVFNSYNPDTIEINLTVVKEKGGIKINNIAGL